MNKNLIIAIVLLIVVGAVSFFGGMKYQQNKKPQFFTTNGTGNMMRINGQGQRQGGMMNRNGFRPVLGEIVSSDDKSITVKLQDGSSKIIIVGDSTQINKADTATKSDLTNGQTVSVFGQENSDGSVTAQNIQINPLQRNANPNQPLNPQQ